MLAGRHLLAIALVIAVGLGTRGITSEASVSMQGDMPRHLMNGVFLYDVVKTGGFWSIDEALRYAQHYFARYPALSLGHHPILLPLTLVPAYAVFGVSVFAGRFVILGFFILATWMVFSIGRRLYSAEVGGWAALLLVTNAFTVRFGQQVLSEMPMIAMSLVALDFLLRFRESGSRRHCVMYVAAVAASLLAKQLAVFMAPVHAVLLLDRRGRAVLFRRELLPLTIGGGVLAALVAILTVATSPYNFYVVLDAYLNQRGLADISVILQPIIDVQLGPALAIAALAGLVVASVRLDRRVVLLLVWIAAPILAVMLVIGPYEPERYSIGIVPGCCLAAGSLIAYAAESVRWRRAAAVALAATVLWQANAARTVHPVGATAYEQAARYVVERAGRTTVLYSAPVDTGYFIFFVRKHDRDRRMVILRADKLLTTSLMAVVNFRDRIKNREEIGPLLNRYGTRFVIIEDRPSGSEVLDWLRDELKTPRFTERLRLPIETEDRRLRGVDLAVYEYNDATPPDPDVELDMDLPLVGRRIRLPLADLIKPGF